MIISVEASSFMDDDLYEAARMNRTSSLMKGEFVLCRTRGVESNILHVAAQYGNEEFIEAALTQVIHTHHHSELLCHKNSKGETPLHLASQFGHKKAVEALLNAHDHSDTLPFGDKVKKLCWMEQDIKGDTPLHKALRYGHQDIAMLLLRRDMMLVSFDNKAGESPAFLAAENFCQRFLHTILDDERYINQSSVSISGPFGMTVFHPSRRLSEDIMLLLMNRRKEVVKHQDQKGKTVLHYAVEEAIEPMVKTLLKADSSLACLCDNDGMTPLHRAASLGSFPMVRAILELSPQSIEICERDDGKTPLHVAKMDARFLAGCLRNTRMKELVNVADDQGNTPLHLALKNSRDLDIVDVLLDASGINWRLRNNEGCTPMDLLESHDKSSFQLKSLTSSWRVKEGVNTELLCNKEVSNMDEIMDHYTSWDGRLTYRGPRGDNILHIAARDGNMRIISEAQGSTNETRLLLLSGENSKGETPLHLAAQTGQREVLQAILLLSISIDELGNRMPDPDHLQVVIRDDSEFPVFDQIQDEVKQQAVLKPWRMKSANGDTPVHKALKHGHANIALGLLTWEPQLASYVSNTDESLLYLAARIHCLDVIEKILETSNKHSISSSGPHGQNPLHAAVKSRGPATKQTLIRSMLEKIQPWDKCRLEKIPPLESSVSPWVGTPLIEKMPGLEKKVDNNGKTPLHYAVELGHHSLVKNLLNVDKSAAFMYDNEGYTPLLRAAAEGYHLCIKSILQLCPHSLELRHASNKKTVLHFANQKTLKECMKHYQGVAKLINERDSEGNTPLHCAVLKADDKKTLQLLSTEGVNFWIRNKKDHTPMCLCEDLMSKGNSKQKAIWDAFKKERAGIVKTRVAQVIAWIMAPETYYYDLLLLTEDNLKKILNNIAVTAVLLVTLTFAATFTIPGGYDQNTGQALRMKEAAIQWFVASDVVAMVLGIGVLLKYTYGVIRCKSLGMMVFICIEMLHYALFATILAFVFGVYAIVYNDAKWVYILTSCVSVIVIMLCLYDF